MREEFQPDFAVAGAAAADVAPAPEPPVVDNRVGPVEVTIRLVIDHFDPGAIPRVVDPMISRTRLSANQGAAYQALFCSLQGQHAQLADGKHVDARPDALRYLLDQIAEQLLPQLELRRAA